MILRVKHNDRFTVVSNSVAQNSALSFSAKGLLLQLLSYSDGLDISQELILRHANNSRTSLRSAVEELVKTGYITRRNERKPNGTFTTVWIVGEAPLNAIERKEQLTCLDEERAPYQGTNHPTASYAHQGTKSTSGLPPAVNVPRPSKEGKKHPESTRENNNPADDNESDDLDVRSVVVQSILERGITRSTLTGIMRRYDLNEVVRAYVYADMTAEEKAVKNFPAYFRTCLLGLAADWQIPPHLAGEFDRRVKLYLDNGGEHGLDERSANAQSA